MSLLKVNTIQSYTDSEPVIINDSFIVTGSNFIKFDQNAIPTSSLGLAYGQLYRTGSNLDEIRIKVY
jgi:hypothetical protein